MVSQICCRSKGSGGCIQIRSLALVWSQAFSFTNRVNAQVDDAAIRKRGQELKRHYNSKDELMRAQDAAIRV